MNRENFPLMKMPKQKNLMSAFDEKCNDLEECVSAVYNLLIWCGFKIKSSSNELRATVFLESVFLQILMNIKDVCQMRGQLLRNEKTDMFKDLLLMLNDNIRTVRKYVSQWHRLLDGEEPTACANAMREDMVEGFREVAEWLEEQARNPQIRERIEKLADELQLNYSTKCFGWTGDGFKAHANMVMNGLMLLTIPSLSNVPENEFGQVFDNTMDEFQKNKAWQRAFEAWKRKLTEEFDLRDLVEDKDKLEFFKKGRKILDEQEQELLEKFGIMHDNIRNASDRSTMGSRIYEHLNSDDEEDNARMGTADLQEYFSYVAQKQYLNEEIDKIKRPLFSATAQKKEGKPQKRRLFKQEVDESLLAECFNEVYVRFFVKKNVEKMQGQYDDVLTLMIYLFIIAEKEGYFFNQDMGPFFRFCTNTAQFQPAKTERTFRNHLNDEFAAFREAALKNFHNQKNISKKAIDDYHKVLGIFHETKKYVEMRKKMTGQ